MKKQILPLLIAFAFIIPMFSCNKDNSSNPPKSKTVLLTQGSWRFKSAMANGSDISNQDPPFSPCIKDNVFTFSANGTGVMSEGATKCDPSDPSTVPFTWNFANNETILHLSISYFNGGSNDFTLESVSDTQLVVSQGYTPIAGPTYFVTITFQH